MAQRKGCEVLTDARRAAFLAERLGVLVLAVITSGVFLDLARQNLRHANRIGDSVGGALLSVRAFRHSSPLANERLTRLADLVFRPVQGSRDDRLFGCRACL